MATDQRIRFTKMTGSGNDFIIVDNRDRRIDADNCRELVRLSCRRKLSVGADGFIIIEDDGQADFKWRFFNADGGEAEMCGNGARCAARFAHLSSIVRSPKMTFRTLAGIIEAEVSGSLVKVKMPSPADLQKDLSLEGNGKQFSLSFINTGVPHAVCFVEDEAALEGAKVFDWGHTLRYHSHFQPAGSNVNFALIRGAHQMAVRTYERGVESETLACGTGCIASALIGAVKKLVSSPVEVQTRSGEILTIYFDQSSRGRDEQDVVFERVYMEGDAKVVYEAELWDETVKSREGD